MLAFKPVVFKALLVYSGEAPKLSWEIGFRLGQISEFSFLIAVLAARSGVIGDRTSYLIQAATLITFIVSPYIVMLRFPTPIAVKNIYSWIIGLKLLPTTDLHQRHKGEVIISVLLLQDVIAIVILLLVQGASQESMPWREAGLLALALPGLMLFAFLFERYILVRLIRRFDMIQEYIFLTAIGWCLGLAELARAIGLSYEIGAFIAGVALATRVGISSKPYFSAPSM